MDFDASFRLLTDYSPFPWQRALYARFAAGEFPDSCNLPTGLGKTNVIAVWLIAWLKNPKKIPRRLVYVVNRRTVVDQTTTEVENIRKKLHKLTDTPLAISTLRGQFADNREWSADPSRPAVICGTVDMIGSRLLFSGYNVGFKARPLHAGFLGQDALLVHDEAHLEPAFQTLIEKIKKEQHDCERTGDLPWPKLRIMALTATPRRGGEVFTLTSAEANPPPTLPEPKEPIHHVWHRLCAKKGIRFVSVNRGLIVKTIGETARDRWKTSGKAILVFVRTLDDVNTVYGILTDKKHGVSKDQVLLLTGTLRGLERDQMVEKQVFRRFQQKEPSDGRTAYLVCTSAGEVGVDISADHMVCDLTTLDSMAQRLGRVNRRGGGQAEVDLVYENEPDPKQKDKPLEKARWKTLEILKRLSKCTWEVSRHDASPAALIDLKLTDEEREAAFAPTPTILPTTDILFDAWALTTIRDKLPGRPPVEPYLHGISDFEPPQTTVAWREELAELTPTIMKHNRLEIEDLLEAYPLKPHEELTAPTDGKNKVFEQLEKIAERDAESPANERLFAWVIDPYGSANAYSLQALVERNSQNRPIVPLGNRTVILPPIAGGLSGGLLKGDEPYSDSIRYDVSGDWWVDGEKTIPRRTRAWSDEPGFQQRCKGMRLICRIEIPVSDGDEDVEPRQWHWFALPKSADDDGSKTSHLAISWEHHTKDVLSETTRLADALLSATPDLHQALNLAARFHDLGKRRDLWQKDIGNDNYPSECYAKSGRLANGQWLRPRQIIAFRHEFGSLTDVFAEGEFKALAGQAHLQELVLHLIAAHHGYARPHFPADLAFDPEPKDQDIAQLAAEVPQRFARLQRKYGRWGLAYLESLLRAADWHASANPSREEES